MSGQGHNSIALEEGETLLKRIARLEEDKQAIQDDIKDVWLEAKSRGFDVKALKEVHRQRKAKERNPQAYEENKAILDTYLAAFGID